MCGAELKIKYLHDVTANRSATKYTLGEQILRILWWPGALLFRCIPRQMYSLRSSLLRLYGARVGRGVHIYNTAIITFPWNLHIGEYSAVGDEVRIYNLGVITIGKNVTVSQGAHLCAGTHDHTQPSFPLLKPSIHIHDGAWIAADAFVGPGVTVGELAIVGARACVFKNVSPATIVGGNPAKKIGQREINIILDELN